MVDFYFKFINVYDINLFDQTINLFLEPLPFQLMA